MGCKFREEEERDNDALHSVELYYTRGELNGISMVAEVDNT